MSARCNKLKPLDERRSLKPSLGHLLDKPAGISTNAEYHKNIADAADLAGPA